MNRSLVSTHRDRKKAGSPLVRPGLIGGGVARGHRRDHLPSARPPRALLFSPHATRRSRSSRPRPSRLGTVRDAGARQGARDRADREGLRRNRGARRDRRSLRDADRPAERRPRRRQGLERSGLPHGAPRRRDQGGRRPRLFRQGRRSPHRRREHAGAPQPRRLHALLLLPLGRCWVSRRSGTSRRPIARARSATRAASSPISAWRSPTSTEIRVWDSTAETRFLVVPMRPAGTEGWSEERLADLVTRDSMIGTGLARRPGEALAHERRARHGRHGRFWPGRGRSRRAGLPRAMGGPGHRDDAGDGRDRRLEPRHVPRRPRASAAALLSQRLLLQELGGEHRDARSRQGSGERRRARRRSFARPGQAAAAPTAHRRGGRRLVPSRFLRSSGAGAGALCDRRSRQDEDHEPGDPHQAAALRPRASSASSSASTAPMSIPTVRRSDAATIRNGSTRWSSRRAKSGATTPTRL